jgi:2-oxoglutarate/2-oxoacid ferredoxin oxidoreductase subunit alpha
VPLGTKNGVHYYTGDEHNETGHISEEPQNRRRMVEKRMKKLDLVEKEVPLEDKLAFFGEPTVENVVVSWGSPKGAILEAIATLKQEGQSVSFLQVRMINPFPAEAVRKALEDKKRVIDIEGNYLGQLGQVIKEETGIAPTHHVLKYTGRPITTTEVYEAIKLILTNQAAERQVLMYGS